MEMGTKQVQATITKCISERKEYESHGLCNGRVLLQTIGGKYSCSVLNCA